MLVRFKLETSLKDLQRLCSAVGALQPQLECSDRKMCEITMILEELCANVIVHGKEKGASEIVVELGKNDGMLTITTRDNGPPFDITDAPEVDVCKPMNERCPGGLGIHLVKQYSDELDYRRENGQNVVAVKKRLYEEEQRV